MSVIKRLLISMLFIAFCFAYIPLIMLFGYRRSTDIGGSLMESLY